MSCRKVHVAAYSGYRGEESPRTIILDAKRIEVVKIDKMWVEEAAGDRSRKRFFKVKGSDGAVRQIYYDEEKMEWFWEEVLS